MSYINRLATYVDIISDEFQSTFTVVDDNTLANMMGHPGDFEQLTKIIRKYLTRGDITFTKTNNYKTDYDIYLIRYIPNLGNEMPN